MSNIVATPYGNWDIDAINSYLSAHPQNPSASVPNNMGVPATPAPIDEGGSYFPTYSQTGYEKEAGISAPQYLSSLDSSGALKTPFAIDPTQSEAFRAMQQTAQSTDLSPWAKMQEQSLGTQTAQQRDQTNAQGQGSTNAAMEQLMTSGNGLDSGSRALVTGMGARSNIMANQNIGAQQTANDLQIQQQDAQTKASMLGQVANAETGAQAANAQTANQDLQNANVFSSNRYNQQMQAWGANKTADAQVAAAGSAGKK